MSLSDDEIREFYDSHPDMKLSDLARITGKTVSELKKILQEPRA
jgi:hypothetical protein